MPDDIIVTPPEGSEPPVVKSWFDDLDPDLKANPSITKFKSPGDLGKSYVELQKTLGKDRVVVPNDKSTPEEWKAFWKKAGAPDKEDDYNVSDDELPEPARVSAEAKSALRKRAAELGVPKKHFDELFGTFKKLTESRFNQEVEGIKNLRGESETKLRDAWGAAYEPKVAGAQKVIDAFFKDKPIRKEFRDVLVNDVGFIQAMSEISEKMSEDVIGGTKRVTMTPDEAQSEYNTMIMDKKGALYNELHPEHDAAVQKLADLQAMIMAGQAE
jgi:hypothetical protein